MSSSSSHRDPTFRKSHCPVDIMRLLEENERDNQFEDSSQSSNSRNQTPDSDSDMSSSDDEQGPLPSLGEFWNGRLPSGSGLDTSIRNLGIDQPLPPIRALTSVPQGHRRSNPAAPPSPVPVRGATCILDARISSSASLPTQLDNPYRLRRPHSPPAGTWSPPRPPPMSSGHPYAPSREGSSRRSYSVETDSDDCHSNSDSVRRPNERPYSLHQIGGSLSHHSPRADSYDSDMEPPRSIHSYPGDRPRRYQMSSSYLGYGPNSADVYMMSEGYLANSSWEEYVEKAGRVNGTGPVMYTCMWRKHEGDPCNYTGKKQLAKRHVESVHLGKKPHVCPQCRKPFPQKTSLDIHIRSVHTFQKPLKCEHCDACFSDPARRHKHYRVEHPDKVVKKTRVKIDYEGIKHLLKK